MAGSTYGDAFRVTTWGESHGAALGAVIDGCPAGLMLDESDIMPFMTRRRPGNSKYATKRSEADEVKILSGVFEGKTTGTPISLMISNTDQHSGDYSKIASYYRPGHADYTFDMKYGFRDYRGGGRSSGRETAGRVAAGAVAVKFLESLGIRFVSYTRSIGSITADVSDPDPEYILSDPLFMPDKEASVRAMEYLEGLIAKGNSAGGVVECRISGLMPGLGEPVFDKLDAMLSGSVMSIGAVKAIEIGDGTAASLMTGLESNDQFTVTDGKAVKTTNHSGGTLGGISDGSQLCLRAHFKPTPSISALQHTVNTEMEEISINIKGRHDPVIVPRAVVVVESMAALTLADLLIRNMGSRMDDILRFYGR
ncbi:MAG: chorismate synthase [Lachnospiraceae bacterium]|nr:chorismate synthase [Lachnospiraceae bacterium]